MSHSRNTDRHHKLSEDGNVSHSRDSSRFRPIRKIKTGDPNRIIGSRIRRADEGGLLCTETFREHLRNNLKYFNAENIANLLQRLARRDDQYASPQLLSQRREAALEFSDPKLLSKLEMGNRELSNIWRSLGELKILDATRVETLLPLIQRRMTQLAALDLADIIFGASWSRFASNDSYLGAVSESCDKLSRKLRELELHKIVDVIRSLNEANLLHSQLLHAAAEILSTNFSKLSEVDKGFSCVALSSLLYRDKIPSLIYQIESRLSDKTFTTNDPHFGGQLLYAATMLGATVPKAAAINLKQTIERLFETRDIAPRAHSLLCRFALPALTVNGTSVNANYSSAMYTEFHQNNAQYNQHLLDNQEGTKPYKIKALLDQNRFSFETEAQIGPYKVDYLINLDVGSANKPHNLVIEFDGSRFHTIYDLKESLDSSVAIGRDSFRDRFVRATGLRVARVDSNTWEQTRDKKSYLLNLIASATKS